MSAIIGYLKEYKITMNNKLNAKTYQNRLINKDFSIIANNCAGAWIYQKLNMPYTTPTIGLYFKAEDYIRFLENLNRYLHSEIQFIKTEEKYPVGLLDGEIKVNFMHYKSEREVKNKWKRRCSRLNMNNLFVIYSDRDGFKPEYLSRFNKLDFKGKAFFSANPQKYNYCIHVKDYDGQMQVGDSRFTFDKYFDFVNWLNNGTPM